MLQEFLTANREAIIIRTRAMLQQRAAPRPTDAELNNGIPLFLNQLIEALGVPSVSRTSEDTQSAIKHGTDLLRMGFTVGQVVHDYGDLCQAVTAVAVDLKASISTEEFQTMNRCLDDAIAHAVTEFSRRREQSISDRGVEHLGVLTHELRNLLNSAMLAFEALKTGSVGASGTTSTLLDYSLNRMRNLIDRSLAEVRLKAGMRRWEQVLVGELIEEAAVPAAIEARRRGLRFAVEPVEYGVAIMVDRQHLASALANLLQNAFKFTRPPGTVSLQTHTTVDRVLIEIGDECGGLPPGKTEELFRLFEQRGRDRSGLGLGLTISRQAVEESGGKIHVHDLPGKGCVFTIDLPRPPP